MQIDDVISNRSKVEHEQRLAASIQLQERRINDAKTALINAALAIAKDEERLAETRAELEAAR